MRHIEDASPALKLIMNHHDAKYFDYGLDGLPIIDVPDPRRPSQYLPSRVTPEMLRLAQQAIDDGDLPYRGALDFPVPLRVRRPRKPGHRQR